MASDCHECVCRNATHLFHTYFVYVSQESPFKGYLITFPSIKYFNISKSFDGYQTDQCKCTMKFQGVIFTITLIEMIIWIFNSVAWWNLEVAIFVKWPHVFHLILSLSRDWGGINLDIHLKQRNNLLCFCCEVYEITL